MGFLDELKKICADFTETANTKEELDFSVKLTNTINGLEAEEAQTLKQYDELKAAYKDAILHGTYGDTKPVEVASGSTGRSLEELLQEAINKKNKEK